LGDDWDLLRKVYKENARGPAKADIGEKIGLNKLYEDMDQFFFITKTNHDKELNEVNQKLMVSQGLFENAKEMLREEKDKNLEMIK
jgi:hypothetical protein